MCSSYFPMANLFDMVLIANRRKIFSKSEILVRYLASVIQDEAPLFDQVVG